jgi:hypothetical protein
MATILGGDGGAARLVCPRCSLAREWAGDRLHVSVGGRRSVLRRAHGYWQDAASGDFVREFDEVEGEDARFGVPLWLRTECCGGRLLWANNLAHLDYLEAYVGADLREHSVGLSWQLPGWMKSAKHRDEVLRHLRALRMRGQPTRP